MLRPLRVFIFAAPVSAMHICRPWPVPSTVHSPGRGLTNVLLEQSKRGDNKQPGCNPASACCTQCTCPLIVACRPRCTALPACLLPCLTNPPKWRGVECGGQARLSNAESNPTRITHPIRIYPIAPSSPSSVYMSMSVTDSPIHAESDATA